MNGRRGARTGALILFTAACATASATDLAPPPPTPAAIAREATAVHAGVGDGTPVVGELAKDAVVTVDIEFDGPDGHWCKVIENGKTAPLGYVLCAALERRQRTERKWTYAGTSSSGTPAASPAEPSRTPVAPEAALRPYSDVRVQLYWAQWCPKSRAARALLQTLGVSVTEYDVDRDPARKAELIARIGRVALPLIDVEGIEILGFSEESLRRAVEKRRKAS